MSQFTGVRFGSVAVDDAIIGTIAWQNPSNALAHDGVDADITPPAGAEHTHYLLVRGFDFSDIPDNATIEQINIHHYGYSYSGAVTQHSIKLRKADGSYTTDDMSSGMTIPSGPDEESVVYGTTWNGEITVADLKSAQFGAALSLSVPSGLGCWCDCIGVEVVYSIGSTAEANEFLRKWGIRGTGNDAFYQMSGIAFDGGDVYVGDRDGGGTNRIKVYDTHGVWQRSLVLTDSANVVGGINPYVAPDGQIYCARAHCIQVYHRTTGALVTEFSSHGTGPTNVKDPQQLWVNAAGEIFVADTGNNRIQVFDINGNQLRSWAHAQMIMPVGIVGDGQGNIYVTARIDGVPQYGVHWFTDAGAVAGQPIAWDLSTAAKRLAIDTARGVLYVCGSGNPHAMHTFDIATRQSLGLYGTSGEGDGHFQAFYGAGGAAVGANGDVYVVDNGDEIQETVHFRVQVFSTARTNMPPTCSLTVDSVVKRTVTVTVAGSDPDGSLAAGMITWGDESTTEFSGAELAALQAGGSVQKSHGYGPAGGTFGIYATVTDDQGADTNSEIAQAVISPNLQPTASFTAVLDPADNLTVTIQANASSDPDGSIASWRFQPSAGADWIAGTVGQASVYSYAEHGEYLLTVEVTDDEGETDDAAAIIPAENDAPTAAGSVSVEGLTATLTDESTDGDGTIASAFVDWGDGSDPKPMTPGGSLEHSYANVTQVYAITLTVTDDDGAVDSVEIPVSITAWAPTFTAEVNQATRTVLVSAAGNTPPEGLTITGYWWDWGDDSDPATGSTAIHRYAAGGQYTITLSITLSDGAMYTHEEMIAMSSITKVAPLLAERGGTVTITGVGFGATQGESTVEVGGEALTDITWSDTSITGKVGTLTAYGAQDVVVTVDGTPETVLTAVKGIMIIDPTDAATAGAVEFAQVSKLYFNGVHVGWLMDAVRAIFRREKVAFTPHERLEPVVQKSFITGRQVDLTMAQLDGVNLSLALNGTYDSATGKVLLSQDAFYGEFSVGIEETNGRMWLFKRCQPADGETTIEINKNFAGLPLLLDVLAMANASDNPVEIYLPAA